MRVTRTIVHRIDELLNRVWNVAVTRSASHQLHRDECSQSAIRRRGDAESLSTRLPKLDRQITALRIRMKGLRSISAPPNAFAVTIELRSKSFRGALGKRRDAGGRAH